MRCDSATLDRLFDFFRRLVRMLPAGSLLICACLVGGTAAQAADSDEEIIAEINRQIRQGWADNQITPSERTTDGEFARRVALDTVGHIPSIEQLTGFLEETAADKRKRFVDQLLDDPDYVKNWSTIWANLLIGRGANNQTNRGQLEKWLRDSFNRNQGHNQFTYELLTAEGDGADNGAVNFLTAHLNEGAVPATSITSRLFLGLQVQCTQCHNHPFNDWKQSQFWGMNAFFRGTRRQRDRAQGEMSLSDQPANAIVFFERRNGLEEAAERKFVDGTSASSDDSSKPRTQLARFVIDPEKPFLSRTQVNRLWGHFFGFGFTRPVDDMGPHNAPSHPELLDYLATEFVRAGYDNKRLIRWITGSDAYQLTSRFHEGNLEDDPPAGNTPQFSRVYVKSFSAEQLYDSLIIATEAHKANRNFEAAENQRRVWLRQFIQAFGTDENDESTTFNGTIPQALMMMNGDLIANATSTARGGFLYRLLEARGGDVVAEKPGKDPKRAKPTAAKAPDKKLGTGGDRRLRAKIDTLFLATLARKPTDAELIAVNRAFKASGSTDPILGLQDLFWAILNSNEFIINH